MENPFPAHIPGLPIFTSQRAQSQLLAGLGATNIIQYETLEARLQELFGDGMYGTAVSALYEYAQTRRMKVNFVDVRHAGPDHMPRFVMTAVVDGRPMSRVEASKKSRCKDGSALVAWELLIQEELTQLQKQLSNASNVGDQMALLSNIQYLHVLLNNPKALCGRKALATIVMKTKQNPQGKVVSLGAGNKCIKGENLGNHGNTIHDCHAEVLGRRAFLRFVYEEVEKYVHGNTRADSIFIPSSRSRDHLMVKDGITFHLYISTAPCGDAAVYSRASAMEEKMSTEPLYTSRQQGELRTKIDAGEGTLPIEVPVQTWLGIKHGGTRLRTMSCSDKICKWNVLGMQGALLSHFVEPIYLSSVTIGDCYVYGHITRALYDRLTHQRPQQQQQEQNLRQELQKRGFELNKPALHQSDIDYSCQETERSRTVGVCWYQGINRAEVIDSQTGVCDASVRREVSLFSKRALCGEFFSLCRSTKQEGLMKCMTYSEAKQSAEMYQEAKKVLCKQFTSKGYGTWLYYPLEVDLFSVQDNFD